MLILFSYQLGPSKSFMMFFIKSSLESYNLQPVFMTTDLFVINARITMFNQSNHSFVIRASVFNFNRSLFFASCFV